MRLPRLGGWCAVSCFLALLVASRAAGAEEGEALLTPEAAVEAALSLDPKVRFAEQELLAARGLAADTRLGLGNPAVNGYVSLDRSRAGVEFAQPLSLSGEGRLAHAAASWSAEAAAQRLRRARLEVAAEVRTLYVRAVVASGVASVEEEGARLAARLRQAVERQADEGEATALDRRLARLAEVQAASGWLEARREEAEARRRLVEAVGGSSSDPPLLTDPLAAVPEARGGEVARADLEAARLEEREARLALSRERAAVLPGVDLGVFVEREEGGWWVGPMLDMELPLIARNGAGRGEALGRLRAAEARVRSAEARVRAEKASSRELVAEMERRLDTLPPDPVAEARAALESLELAYAAGALDLPAVLLLQREVLDGWRAALELAGQRGEVLLDRLLVEEDPVLLGGGR